MKEGFDQDINKSSSYLSPNQRKHVKVRRTLKPSASELDSINVDLINLSLNGNSLITEAKNRIKDLYGDDSQQTNYQIAQRYLHGISPFEKNEFIASLYMKKVANKTL